MTEENSQIFKMVLYVAETMVKSGSETYRAEDTVKRMLASRGFVNISTFVSPTVIIIGDNTKDGVCYIQNIDKRSSNLARIELVNNLSRSYVNHEINTVEAFNRLKKINEQTLYPYWLVMLGCSIACAVFSILIGGTFTDFIATIIASSISLHISEKISEVSNTQFLGYFCSALIVTFVAFALNKIGLGANLDSIIVGSVLPLVPGVALTSGVRDVMFGDLLSGMARVMEAATIAIAIAFGVGTSLTIASHIGGILWVGLICLY